MRNYIYSNANKLDGDFDIVRAKNGTWKIEKNIKVQQVLRDLSVAFIVEVYKLKKFTLFDLWSSILSVYFFFLEEVTLFFLIVLLTLEKFEFKEGIISDPNDSQFRSIELRSTVFDCEYLKNAKKIDLDFDCSLFNRSYQKQWAAVIPSSSNDNTS